MRWNYSGDPSTSLLDETRFILGDTCRENAQVSDDEVLWALSKQGDDTRYAAMMLCYHLSRKYSRLADCSVGDVSRSCSQLATAYRDRGNELKEEANEYALVAPSFGGLSIAEKISLDENPDAVQPAFSVGMDDNPGVPGDRDERDYYSRWPVNG